MPEPLNITRLEEILKSLGFHEAKEYVSFPIVPGADGADTFWTRGSDLLQVSWSTGEIEPPPEYILRYAKQYKPGHPPDLEEKGELLTEETLMAFLKKAGVI
ncbi:MAG: hypothetical protein DRN61_04245 [Thaumarchaeota archaeon]|nr:MAG: hypothetical protein DRN61_04245 [Nitrososphaerota archaeon]